jgi:hypothetical protein
MDCWSIGEFDGLKNGIFILSLRPLRGFWRIPGTKIETVIDIPHNVGIASAEL